MYVMYIASVLTRTGSQWLFAYVSSPHRSIKTLPRFIESTPRPVPNRTELPTETERAEVGLITSLLSPCLVVIRGKSGLIVEFEKPATGSHGRLTVCVSRVGPAVTQACFGGWKNRDGINSVTLIFSTRWFIEFLSSVFFPD